MELKPGGTFLYNMKTPEGFKMWGKFVYREVAEPERLIIVVSFSFWTPKFPSEWKVERLRNTKLPWPDGVNVIDQKTIDEA